MVDSTTVRDIVDEEEEDIEKKKAEAEGEEDEDESEDEDFVPTAEADSEDSDEDAAFDEDIPEVGPETGVKSLPKRKRSAAGKKPAKPKAKVRHPARQLITSPNAQPTPANGRRRKAALAVLPCRMTTRPQGRVYDRWRRPLRRPRPLHPHQRSQIVLTERGVCACGSSQRALERALRAHSACCWVAG